LANSVANQNSFRAHWRTVFTNPAYIARRGLEESISAYVRQLNLAGNGIWLDVGCGSKPYERLFNVERYIGMDIEQSGHPAESKRFDILYDGEKFPIETASIDGVICTQVLEHAKLPERLISEIERVLKPGGTLILTAPFFWPEHEQPYDFTRFSSFGLVNLLESKGFHILEYRKTTGSIEAIAQAFSAYIINNLGLRLSGWNRLVTLLLCAPIQIAGLLMQRILPDKGDLFLDSAILASKPGEGI